jgi:hypothetical protein
VSIVKRIRLNQTEITMMLRDQSCIWWVTVNKESSSYRTFHNSARLLVEFQPHPQGETSFPNHQNNSSNSLLNSHLAVLYSQYFTKVFKTWFCLLWKFQMFWFKLFFAHKTSIRKTFSTSTVSGPTFDALQPYLYFSDPRSWNRLVTLRRQRIPPSCRQHSWSSHTFAHS